MPRGREILSCRCLSCSVTPMSSAISAAVIVRSSGNRFFASSRGEALNGEPDFGVVHGVIVTLLVKLAPTITHHADRLGWKASSLGPQIATLHPAGRSLAVTIKCGDYYLVRSDIR